MVLLEGGHDAGPLAVDGLGHQLLAPEVQMQPIGSQTGGQLLIFVDNSGQVNVVGLAADPVVNKLELALPVVRRRLIKGLLDIGRVDGRQGHEDGNNPIIRTFLPEGIQVADHGIAADPAPKAVAARS